MTATFHVLCDHCDDQVLVVVRDAQDGESACQIAWEVLHEGEADADWEDEVEANTRVLSTSEISATLDVTRERAFEQLLELAQGMTTDQLTTLVGFVRSQEPVR